MAPMPRKAVHDGKALIVVEGYVDVIAMVIAGFEGAVAPIGTALTEEQLGLLWSIADEPMLCFDGDKAGRGRLSRGRSRVAEVAAGKSLSSPCFRKGRTPTILIRSGGRGAMDEVLKSARPLAEILWMRETEATAFDTPERRAALEARLPRLPALSATKQCGNITGRISRRACALFMPAQAQRRGSSAAAAARRAGLRPVAGGRRATGAPPSGTIPRTVRAAIRRGSARARSCAAITSAMPPREALILLAVIEHPWLLENHPEEFAEIEFFHPDADRLRRAILEPASGEVPIDPRKAAGRPREARLGPRCFAGPGRRSRILGLAGPRRARRADCCAMVAQSLPCIARRAR